MILKRIPVVLERIPFREILNGTFFSKYDGPDKKGKLKHHFDLYRTLRCFVSINFDYFRKI